MSLNFQRLLQAATNVATATVASVVANNNDDNSSESNWMRGHEANSTSITTSVTIHVTPDHYYMVSWGILWTGFFLAGVLASLQVWKEYNWILVARQTADLEQGSVGASGDSDGVSTADKTRSMFRRLLLLSIICRTIMIPVQIWATPIWLQFVADTLPEMAFASAWTLLVSFLVQLVGVATGTGTNTAPGIVIQLTAYVVYILLAATYFWSQVASILLYALLCCIYAALFGTVLYFCPRLWTLLYPNLSQHSGLAIRLAICSILCIVVFGSRTVGFALKVVAPPRRVSWWWTYGALELFPAVLFLVMMRPNKPQGLSGTGGNGVRHNNGSINNGASSNSLRTNTPPGKFVSNMRRSESNNSRRSGGEGAPLLGRPNEGMGMRPAGYGASMQDYTVS